MKSRHMLQTPTRTDVVRRTASINGERKRRKRRRRRRRRERGDLRAPSAPEPRPWA